MKRILYTTLQYLLTILISLGISLLLRLLVIDFYTIPSDSMSPTILPGEFILVEKVSFGARMYQNFDFLKTQEEPKTWRIKGFSSIQRDDIMVFNFPYRKGWNKIRMHFSRFYIKRCIGLPGDTLSIRNGFYEVNGKRGFGNLEGQQELADYRGEFPRGIYHTIPFDHRISWNLTQLGPLYIPKEGDQIHLDSTTYRLYHKMIEYESGLKLQERVGKIYKGTTIMERYTFSKNWYFFAGDQLWNSQDSRYIGLIPEDFIIGKAILVLTSRNPETGEYRWKRFLKKVQ